MNFWESCSLKEKIVLLAAPRYAFVLGLILIHGMIRSAANSPSGPVLPDWVFAFDIVSVLLYNTLAVFFLNRFSARTLSAGMTTLDFLTAETGMILILLHPISSPLPAMTAELRFMGFGLLGIPLLAVVFGRRSAWVPFLWYGTLIVTGLASYPALVALFIPLLVAPVIGMAYAINMTYVFGYVSELGQEFKQEAEALASDEKLLRLELDSFVEELQKTSSSKEKFLLSASRELVSPIERITGWSIAIAGDRGTPEDAVRVASGIFSNAQYLLNLLQDLLDLAYISSGKIQFDLEEIQVNDFLREVAQNLAPLAQKKNLEIRLNLREDLPPVMADASRILQIFYNLVGNAVKYTEAGEVVLSTSGEVRNVKVEIADTGPGIAPEDLPHIFDEYARGKNAVRQAGSGLGLTITRKLVQAQGGEIGVESIVGGGSRFTVIFPGAQRA